MASHPHGRCKRLGAQGHGDATRQRSQLGRSLLSRQVVVRAGGAGPAAAAAPWRSSSGHASRGWPGPAPPTPATGTLAGNRPMTLTRRQVSPKVPVRRAPQGQVLSVPATIYRPRSGRAVKGLSPLAGSDVGLLRIKKFSFRRGRSPRGTGCSSWGTECGRLLLGVHRLRHALFQPAIERVVLVDEEPALAAVVILDHEVNDAFLVPVLPRPDDGSVQVESPPLSQAVRQRV
jgi:hypothetical protein